MSQPIIALTTSSSSKSGLAETKLKDTYIQAVLNAGGTPLLIPNSIPEKTLSEAISLFDGLLLTGGGDIHPDLYNGQSPAYISGIDWQRDRTEIALLGAAIENNMPFLGICRGIQVINVAQGGTLYEDISDQHSGAIKHDYYPDWPRHYLAHEVEIDPDSRLALVLDRLQVKVNSLHHQAVRRAANDLFISARAPDGIVEGLELPEHPFGIGVQWHPECLQAHSSMRALFRAFIEAAAKYCHARRLAVSQDQPE